MILADTSVWVEFLRHGERRLERLLARGGVLIHPMVIGELVLGGLPRNGQVRSLLERLPRAVESTHAELVRFVYDNDVVGTGVGYVDAHLLAAAALTSGAGLWTKDAKLATLAGRLGLA